MGKKKIFIIVAIVLIIVATMSIVYIKQNSKNIAKTNTEEKVIEEPLELKGNFIWHNSNDDNTWVCFRKKVTLTKKEAEKVVAQIGADSKYWLYINGELIIRDGALKRGEKKDSIYYDQVDLSKYFKEGENTIAILGWYWGGQSFSHISSGQAGVFFQAKAGKKWIITDDTWKVKKYEAYKQDGVKPNYRLMEYNVFYDANLGDENWYKVGYDDTTWETAKLLNIVGSLPWGEMIKREIPMFKDFELKEYENMADYKDYVTTEDEVLEMKLPYNAQFTPYLKIEAKSGIEINVQTDTYEDVSGNSLRFSYVTKDGLQEFESPAWINGEIAYYHIPAGVKVISLGYRETGYDTSLVGNFKSDDEFLNKLWQQAQRTLYVNMRDSYMDCPNRERAQWLGDMNLEMMEAMYSLDTNANALYEKGIKVVLGWSDEKRLYAVSPNNLEPMHLPAQTLAGIVSMLEYYEYTGKKEFLEEVYSYAKDYLSMWKINEGTNLVEWNSDKSFWEWGDSTEGCDYKAIENAWYYYATKALKEMSEVLVKTQDKEKFTSDLEKLKIGYESLWTDEGYKSSESKSVDERANAIAVLAGIADVEKYPTIQKIFESNYESTPYMEKYVLEAMCKMGDYEASQERIKERYEEMVNGDNACSTLWEKWDYKSGTKNHAWSGGPLIIMSKYYAGIEPLKPGYEEILVKPNFGSLNSIDTQFETVKGKIKMNAKKDENGIQMTLDVPAKTLIALPKYDVLNVDNNKIDKEKYEKEDENYIYYYVDKGKHEINCSKGEN